MESVVIITVSVLLDLRHLRDISVQEEKVRYLGTGYVLVLRMATGFSHPLTQNATLSGRRLVHKQTSRFGLILCANQFNSLYYIIQPKLMKLCGSVAVFLGMTRDVFSPCDPETRSIAKDVHNFNKLSLWLF